MDQVVKNTLFYALLGTLIHSAGCVINDMLDRDFDRKVGTSHFRPDYRRSVQRDPNRTLEESTNRIWSCV